MDEKHLGAEIHNVMGIEKTTYTVLFWKPKPDKGEQCFYKEFVTISDQHAIAAVQWHIRNSEEYKGVTEWRCYRGTLADYEAGKANEIW